VFARNSDQVRRTVEIYDPVDDSFITLTAALHSARERHVALQFAADRVLIYGGAIIDQSNAAEMYEADAATFTITASPQVPFCTGAKAAVLSTGEVVIAGGEQKDGNPMGNVLLSSPGGRGLYFGDQLRIARTNHAFVPLVDGRAIIVGGTSGEMRRLESSTELFDVVTRTFAVGPNLSTARTRHTANLLVTGKVLVIGG
jgi:hypothetical protein